MDFLSISLFYILERYVFRIYYFLYHWYARGFRKMSNWTINYHEGLDYKFALQINLRNIFQPMYQDYSFVGHIFGFILRSCRIIMAAIIYVIVIFLALAAFLIWAAIPAFALYEVITSF